MSRYPGLEIVLQEEKKDMSDKNTLYLECRSGISGDMTVAALLDLGATEENLRRTLAKLPVGGYEIKVQRLIKNGLEVCDFDVILKRQSTAMSMSTIRKLMRTITATNIFTGIARNIIIATAVMRMRTYTGPGGTSKRFWKPRI